MTAHALTVPDRHGSLVAGVDEAGRGPLAGPVVAAAVILDPVAPIDELKDSKVLSERRRRALAAEIREKGLAWAVGWADVSEIDSINVLAASMLAMRRAILGLSVVPKLIKVDGNRLPCFEACGHSLAAQAVVHGDATVPCISAASIIAKVQRDRMMRRYDGFFPDYGFARHKGYATLEHRDCLRRLGPCEQHRRSFRPLNLSHNLSQ